ncbi:hypothetical protein BDQ12DRAFT_727128 [Crucibulum laeve]|uniref:ubiquitinyl hydrolase 1 n=1 Tax=Crucibulum laeve TaxID=68775 RepID=A0A5C3LPK9_9AGAR|nr:hypothetical protein BDQ12DRAFT_727128 [Crucibulum laeve]
MVNLPPPEPAPYLVTHIFLPPELPQQSDHSLTHDKELATTVHEISQHYYDDVSHHDQGFRARWQPMNRMLQNLCNSVKDSILDPEEIRSQIHRMSPGDVTAFMIRAQNAAVVLRQSTTEVIFESFEVSPSTSAVMEAKGKLLVSYPGPAIAVSLSVVSDPNFLKQLSLFLSEMDRDPLDSTPVTVKAGSKVTETRDTSDPRYIIDLLTGILRGIGQIADVPRIQKRIADDVLWHKAKLPWRRSGLWLVIRVVLQTSLHCASRNHQDYKVFMLFFMSKLLHQFSHCESGLSSELLNCMMKKVGWRLSKIRDTAPTFIYTLVDEATKKAGQLIQRRWDKIQAEQACSPPWNPEQFNLQVDTTLSLTRSRAYLTEVIRNQSAPLHTSGFHPDEARRRQAFVEYVDNMQWTGGLAKNPFILGDFEQAVSDTLPDWVAANLNQESSCTVVADAIKEYTTTALSFYCGNPESLSLTFLTYGELWMALDRIAVHHYPLLEEYSPEIPTSLFEALLLRKDDELSRLERIQLYLKRRHDSRVGVYPSLFSQTISWDILAARYFDSSPSLQKKLRTIEQKAQVAWDQKISELVKRNADYSGWKQQAEAMSHEQYYSYFRYHCYYSCTKCSLQQKMNSLSIDMYEWPLPRDTVEKKMVVFEIHCPLAIKVWRDVTYTFLHDHCGAGDAGSVQPPKTLVQYYNLTDGNHRISLASSTKSFVQSHYNKISQGWPLAESAVCVNNGLKFKPYDVLKDSWVKDVSSTAALAHHCTFRLPPGPYEGLQFAVGSTSHMTNTVVAAQSECPTSLGIHEFLAFGCLRSGSRLQWLNIARELRAQSLSLDRLEVYMQLMQSACQVGSLSDHSEWEWHKELQVPEFGSVLLVELGDQITHFQDNWASGLALQTIVALTSRVLASVTEENCVTRACELLRKARTVTRRWVSQVKQILLHTTDEKEIRHLQTVLVQAATICRQTYDAPSLHLPHLLRSTEDITEYIFCAITIYDNTTGLSAPDFSGLLCRDWRLSHYVEPNLCKLIHQDRHGLDDAIREVWTTYQPGTPWIQLPSPNSSWFVSSTSSNAREVPQMIHYNVLEGRLLIAGKPIGRLPRDITQHETYKMILGQSIIDVIPADIPGMMFATSSKVGDVWQLYFTLRESDGELIVRAKTESCGILELIPPRKLEGDLPHMFTTNCAPWMDLETSEIEFRLLKNCWLSTSTNWRLRFSVSGCSTMRTKGAKLVDIYSPTAFAIYQRLKPIEHLCHLIISYPLDRSSLLMELPRSGFSFFINKNNELESRNLKGMVVDDNQSSGTMFGLQNQLILRPKDSTAKTLPQSRIVLIPEGEASIQRHQDHVRVIINTLTVPTVKFHRYCIDSDFGRLAGNASLRNRLYKAYLHALTSHCLPEPLLGHTGTEEALLELRSAGCQSFMSLESDEASILESIASLVPRRAFYPEHLKVMQEVQPSPLSALSQNYQLYEAAKAIVNHAARLQVFQPSSSAITFSFREEEEEFLLQRAAQRNILFYSNTPKLEGIDITHKLSRDLPSTFESEVQYISSLVYSWRDQLKTARDLMGILTKLGKIAGVKQIISLDYGNNWLTSSLSDIWLPWYNQCRYVSARNGRYPLLFTLSAMAFTSSDTRSLLPTMLSFATVSHFEHLHPPEFSDYDFSYGFEPTKGSLLSIISSKTRNYNSSPESRIAQNHGEKPHEHYHRCRRLFDEQCERKKELMAEEFLHQWPCGEAERPRSADSERFDISEIMREVNSVFQNCYRNQKLQKHIQDVQRELDRHHNPFCGRQTGAFSRVTLHSNTPISSKRKTIDECFSHFTPPSLKPLPNASKRWNDQPQESEPESSDALNSLISEFTNNSDKFYKLYGKGLENSRQCLESEVRAVLTHSGDIDVFISHREDYQLYLFESVIEPLKNSLQPSEFERADRILYHVGLWPRLTLRSILSNLASSSPHNHKLPPNWKKTLIHVAKAFLLYQQSQRLVASCLNGNQDDLSKELANMTILNDNLSEPEDSETFVGDWLLIQLECNFLVRQVQLDIAREMIMPSSNQNTALQLNMGEGKSSVIVPLVATCLADGKKLVRIVVLRPLARQMFQILVDRLGGLANRRIFYMPFSRDVKLGPQEAQHIHAMYEECCQTRGILVFQPDDMLSYKLMGIERQYSSSGEVGRILLESRQWLHASSRDIIDEADEILHVRYQLVYPVGKQAPFQGSPYRWVLIQNVLQLIRKHTFHLRHNLPQGIEIEECYEQNNVFPIIRFLDNEAAEAVLSKAIRDALSLLNIQFAPPGVKESACEFIKVETPANSVIDVVRDHFDDEISWNQLLLLRGLFVDGILRYAFKEKRWRVNFGLDPRRSEPWLAVPYRAKDVPAARAEFSHPDVTIVLSCLSYYYGGLSEGQLKTCFDLLLKTPNPDLEYETWICESIPETLRKLSAINIDSAEQWNELVRLFTRNSVVINFFLSQVVFPRKMKQFPEKLATSSWDIAEEKGHVTTGFSGTNDNQYLFPLSLQQRDHKHQLGTNAKVLSYLLLPENNYYVQAARDDGEHISAQQLIDLIMEQDPEIRVLLDVGAQVLELQNHEVAGYWLKKKSNAEAAIFFDDNDELVVLTRDGVVEPFVSSPFCQKVDECVLYLDDAHTRGTDVKLPRGFRAAVTLGPKVTKDRLVQGCMRMRKLGSGHTVMFLVPPEVDRSIREAARKSDDDIVGAVDVLRWAMLKTCSQIKYQVPQWVQQGIDHEKRSTAWCQFVQGDTTVEQLSSAWNSQEARTLEDMYSSQTCGSNAAPELPPKMVERCKQLGVAILRKVLDEEEEREVTHEVEREVQVQRPPRATAATPTVHPDVRRFIENGLIAEGSPAFLPAFSPFKLVLSEKAEPVWSSNVFITKDFATTIVSEYEKMDDYLNTGNWVVTSKVYYPALIVILSSYEVNELLPRIRASKSVNLHVYTPRVLQATKTCEDLTFYSVPQLPRFWTPPVEDIIRRMNLLAGQLFFRDYDAYQRTCEFLALYTKEIAALEELVIQNDGFIMPQHRRGVVSSPFDDNQLPFLRWLISARRKQVEYTRTHVGKMLEGKVLTEDDFKD